MTTIISNPPRDYNPRRLKISGDHLGYSALLADYRHMPEYAAVCKRVDDHGITARYGMIALARLTKWRKSVQATKIANRWE